MHHHVAHGAYCICLLLCTRPVLSMVWQLTSRTNKLKHCSCSLDFLSHCSRFIMFCFSAVVSKLHMDIVLVALRKAAHSNIYHHHATIKDAVPKVGKLKSKAQKIKTKPYAHCRVPFDLKVSTFFFLPFPRSTKCHLRTGFDKPILIGSRGGGILGELMFLPAYDKLSRSTASSPFLIHLENTITFRPIYASGGTHNLYLVTAWTHGFWTSMNHCCKLHSCHNPSPNPNSQSFPDL
jgi:hypothetical protein